MPKWGIEFVSPRPRAPQLRRVRRRLGQDACPTPGRCGAPSSTTMLFRNAAAQGARTLEGCRVREVEFDADGATVQAEPIRQAATAHATWRARFVVDASGRDTLLANQFRLQAEEPAAQQLGAVRPLHRRASACEGRLEGNITIFWFEHGWFWFIPLADGTHQRRRGVLAVLPEVARQAADASSSATRSRCARSWPRRLEGATLVDDAVHATGNYSYSSTHCSGERYLMLGDAYRLRRPGVLVRRLPRDAQRLRRRRHGRPPRSTGRASAPPRAAASRRACARARASSRGSSSA